MILGSSLLDLQVVQIQMLANLVLEPLHTLSPLLPLIIMTQELAVPIMEIVSIFSYLALISYLVRKEEVMYTTQGLHHHFEQVLQVM